VPNVLRGLPARLDAVAGEAVDRIADTFEERAERLGGRVDGRQLTARARQRRAARGEVSVVMVGTPAGYWSWREYGITAHRIRARRGGGDADVMAGPGLRHPISGPVVHPGIAPGMAWSRTVRDVERVAPAEVERTLERAVR
jgi:hypothetical protein